jgi:hypothetical protein
VNETTVEGTDVEGLLDSGDDEGDDLDAKVVAADTTIRL